MFSKIASRWSGQSAPPVDKPYDPTDPKMNPLNPQGLKPCCACPETKRARDDCYIKFDVSEADEKCKKKVQDHILCMRSLGFKI